MRLFGSCVVVAGADLRHIICGQKCALAKRCAYPDDYDPESASACAFTTTERALNSGQYIALQFQTRRDNALTCCALRFVELTAGDQSAPEGYLFSALSLTPSRISYVIRQCATEIKNALAVGETAGRFDYHKSMELT